MEAAQNCYAEGLRSSAWHFALEMKISPGLQRLHSGLKQRCKTALE